MFNMPAPHESHAMVGIAAGGAYINARDLTSDAVQPCTINPTCENYALEKPKLHVHGLAQLELRDGRCRGVFWI